MVQATAIACTELMTHFLNGLILPYLLTEHLVHSLDGPGPSSHSNRRSSIIARLGDNVLGKSTRQASIGT